MKQTKIVILGAGHVGTHCALSLMFRSLANEIVLIDTDEEKAKSQALDLDDMGACLPAKVVIRSGSMKILTMRIFLSMRSDEAARRERQDLTCSEILWND